MRWYAVLSALLLLLPQGARAAENLDGAARELGRKTAALVGRGGPVSLTWRNLSSLGPSEVGAARRAFEGALRSGGTRVGDNAPAAQAQVTLSENSRQYLLVVEIQKGDEREVWISSWNRPAAAPEAGTSMRLERTLLWSQSTPILDVAVSGDTALVLSPSWITWLTRQNGQWAEGPSTQLPGPKNWPRDLRGQIRIHEGTFQADLPGVSCKGDVGRPSSLDCRPSDEPWALDAGGQAKLLANFASGRNFFDGRVAAQNGVRKTLPPFFSAAAAGDAGGTMWVMAMLDGRAQVLDESLEPVGSVTGWGSDVAGTGARCGGTSPVLATKPGDSRDTDAIQAYAVSARTAKALTPVLTFPGPVTALWPAGNASATAVTHDLATGKYEAYAVTVVCAP